MKCLNKLFIILAVLSLGLCGCGKTTYPLGYGEYNLGDNFNMDDNLSDTNLKLFASDICATDADNTATSSINYSALKSACVFNVNDCDTLYSFNANERVNPASLTKIMTALIVLENCNLDDTVTVGDVKFNESGVQLFGLKEGDKITVKDLLYIDLVYSGNDASLALSNYVAGSEDEFARMMNEKAASLGASNTNFVNSHGLSNDNHYTTAYDLYLIFNAALKYTDFVTIINTTKAEISYVKESGDIVTKTITTTNKFLTDDYKAPDNAIIVGGKTGSTSAAGKCLILYAKNAEDEPYIAVVMGAGDESELYNSMITLCRDTVK